MREGSRRELVERHPVLHPITEAFRHLVKTTSGVIDGTVGFADVARVVDLERLLTANLPAPGNGANQVAASPYLAVNQVA